MIKTKIQLLNDIAAKLGGDSNASVGVEALNNIANALGDTAPDEMVTESEALENILEYVDGGGGGSITPILTMNVDAKEDGDFENVITMSDGKLVYNTIAFRAGHKHSISTYLIGEIYLSDEYDFAYWLPENAAVKSMVNCTSGVDSGGMMYLKVTDSTQNASANIELGSDEEDD